MVASYTANLATFLVTENKTTKLEKIDDLFLCGVEGETCPVDFGAKRGGATYTFFEVDIQL